jgi:hypothetical protein
MSTTAAPRFARTTARGVELELGNPLPPTLAKLPEIRQRAAQHGRVAARATELRARRVELSRELAQQEEADQQAATQAHLEGRSPARRQKAASIRKKLEETEGEIGPSELAVQRSADSLLALTQPLAVRAVEKAAKDQQAALTRAQELLGALDAALEEAGNFRSEELWLHRLDGAEQIEPYRPSGDPGLWRLRSRLRDAWGEWQQRDEDQQAEVRRHRRYEAEEAARWEQERERAEREDRERRVRYEG